MQSSTGGFDDGGAQVPPAYHGDRDDHGDRGAPGEHRWQGASRAGGSVRGEGARLARETRAELRGLVQRRKERLAARLDGVAAALRDTGERLDEEIVDGLGEVAERGARRVAQAARYVNDREIEDMARDAGDLARRRPALFVAGTLLTGFLLARFFKSTRDRDTLFDQEVSYEA